MFNVWQHEKCENLINPIGNFWNRAEGVQAGAVASSLDAANGGALRPAGKMGMPLQFQKHQHCNCV
eukprot:4273312-Amphidinium_carterae.1